MIDAIPTIDSTNHCACAVVYGFHREERYLLWQDADVSVGYVFLAGQFDGYAWNPRSPLMPANSKAFRRLAAIAEHHPEKVSRKNRGILGMTKKQLHEYASTPERGLPYKKKKHAHSEFEMP